MPIAGTYDLTVVALSIVVAIATSYTALDLASRIRASVGWARFAWLSTAAVAMGGGVWAMHFVAMLAFHLAGMVVTYDVGLTAVSLAVPILVTGVSFFVMSRTEAPLLSLMVSGLCMGLGIVAMHYIGMAAMRVPAELSYSWDWVAVSVVIAISAATIALWLAGWTDSFFVKGSAAIAMGLAISGMHYAAMAGASFCTNPGMDLRHQPAAIEQSILALAVAGSTFLILVLALLAAMVDRRLALLAEREAQALRLSEERFRSLYTKTPLLLHSLDETGRIEHVSEAWLSTMGYPAEEVIGRPLINFMVESSARQAVTKDWPALLQADKLAGAEYRMVTKAGAFIDVIASATVVRDSGGQCLLVLGGLTDVTERRRAEEALRQSQKIEAVGQLTGGIAHDFNNLLAVVIGNLELLRKRLTADPQGLKLLESALQGAQRGAGLTQRMLAFARKQELQPEIVDLPNLVRGMRDLLSRSLGPTIRIDTRFPLQLPCAHVDANQMELALLNLAVNARDAMPDGGELSISAFEHVVTNETEGCRPGRYVCLSVKDTGHGMDETTLSRAMEPFFTTKGVGKGTGLGLSMVHGLAAQSEGRLVLQSQPGIGTTAELWLPAAEAAPKMESPEPPAIESTHDPLTILIVDDDDLVLMNTAAILEDLGHTTIQAGSASEALHILRADGSVIDVLITDHAMPGMTGLQLAEIIQKEKPSLPVLIVSGYAEISGAAKSFARLRKPFSQADLAQALSSLLRHSHSAAVVPFKARYATDAD